MESIDLSPDYLKTLMHLSLQMGEIPLLNIINSLFGSANLTKFQLSLSQSRVNRDKLEILLG